MTRRSHVTECAVPEHDRQVILQGRDQLDPPRGTELTIASGTF